MIRESLTIAKRGAAVLVGTALACFAAETGDTSHSSGKGVWYPCYDKQGRMTSQLFGDSAKTLPNDDIEFTNMRMELFADGRTDARVYAERCIFSPKAETIVSDSAVRLEKGNTVVTGEGLRWQAKDGTVKIFAKVRVKINRAENGVLSDGIGNIK